MKNKIFAALLILFCTAATAFSREEKPLWIHEMGLTFASLTVAYRFRK